MNRTYLFYILLPLLAFIVAYKFATSTWNGQITSRTYYQGRVLAESERPIKSPELVSKDQKQTDNIIWDLKVIRSESDGIIGLKFGSYISEFGQTLCSVYSKVELVLHGDGVAVSGKSPKIVIEGDCPNEGQGGADGVFPIFLISDCQSDQDASEFIQLSNGTELRISNTDFPISEPDWVIEKLTFIDENNSVKSLDFNHLMIKEILKSSGKSKKSNFQAGSDFISIPCN